MMHRDRSNTSTTATEKKMGSLGVDGTSSAAGGKSLEGANNKRRGKEDQGITMGADDSEEAAAPWSSPLFISSSLGVRSRVLLLMRPHP